jgi:hypothetical protein
VKTQTLQAIARELPGDAPSEFEATTRQLIADHLIPAVQKIERERSTLTKDKAEALFAIARDQFVADLVASLPGWSVGPVEEAAKAAVAMVFGPILAPPVAGSFDFESPTPFGRPRQK